MKLQHLFMGVCLDHYNEVLQAYKMATRIFKKKDSGTIA